MGGGGPRTTTGVRREAARPSRSWERRPPFVLSVSHASTSRRSVARRGVDGEPNRNTRDAPSLRTGTGALSPPNPLARRQCTQCAARQARLVSHMTHATTAGCATGLWATTQHHAAASRPPRKAARACQKSEKHHPPTRPSGLVLSFPVERAAASPETGRYECCGATDTRYGGNTLYVHPVCARVMRSCMNTGRDWLGDPPSGQCTLYPGIRRGVGRCASARTVHILHAARCGARQA